jgi:hypothetical protein
LGILDLDILEDDRIYDYTKEKYINCTKHSQIGLLAEYYNYLLKIRIKRKEDKYCTK